MSMISKKVGYLLPNREKKRSSKNAPAGRQAGKQSSGGPQVVSAIRGGGISLSPDTMPAKSYEPASSVVNTLDSNTRVVKAITPK